MIRVLILCAVFAVLQCAQITNLPWCTNRQLQAVLGLCSGHRQPIPTLLVRKRIQFDLAYANDNIQVHRVAKDPDHRPIDPVAKWWVRVVRKSVSVYLQVDRVVQVSGAS